MVVSAGHFTIVALVDSLVSCASSWLYLTLCVMVICDIVTGVGLAVKNHALSSSVNNKGMISKVIAISVPLLLYPVFDLAGVPDINVGILLAFIMPNALSLVENLHELGFDMPNQLVKYFDKFK